MRHPDVTPTVVAQVEIARETGAAIINIYEETRHKGADAKNVFVTYKIDGSPWTRADLQAHQIIFKKACLSCAASSGGF